MAESWAGMLGFGCGVDDGDQVIVTRVLQESPAAYSGQVGIGDVLEAIDGRMIIDLQQFAVAADGPVGACVRWPARAQADCLIAHAAGSHAINVAGGHSSGAGAAAKRVPAFGIFAPHAAAAARRRGSAQRGRESRARRAGGA